MIPAERTTDKQTGPEFERLRPYLLRVAYSHLGTLSEAADVVQDAWLRLVGADRGEIRDLRAWVTTVVSRLALDALTSARARREPVRGPVGSPNQSWTRARWTRTPELASDLTSP
jgi:RNA polymerase sigma-70 factor, ECF subfamily